MPKSHLAEQLLEVNDVLGGISGTAADAARNLQQLGGTAGNFGVGGHGGAPRIGQGGDGHSGDIAGASGLEKNAGALGESVEYVKKLMAAALWAGISPARALSATKQFRDTLIAAWVAATGGGLTGDVGSGGAGGSGNSASTRAPITDNRGNVLAGHDTGINTLNNAAAGAAAAASAKTSAAMLEEIKGLRKDVRDSGLGIRTGGA